MLSLNPKCSIKPLSAEVCEKHPLWQELEILRRVMIEVKKPDLENAGLKLHFDPKVRKLPLQYLVVEVDIELVHKSNER